MTRVDMDPGEDAGRFQHLLAPIRDLVANWNVDVAGELGDYLELLEGLTFALDGESQSLNFAEGKYISCTQKRDLREY